MNIQRVKREVIRVIAAFTDFCLEGIAITEDVLLVRAAQAVEVLIIEGHLAVRPRCDVGAEHSFLVKDESIHHVVAVEGVRIGQHIVVVERDGEGVQGFVVGEAVHHLGILPYVAERRCIDLGKDREGQRPGAVCIGEADGQGVVHGGGLVAPSEAQRYAIILVHGKRHREVAQLQAEGCARQLQASNLCLGVIVGEGELVGTHPFAGGTIAQVEGVGQDGKRGTRLSEFVEPAPGDGAVGLSSATRDIDFQIGRTLSKGIITH